MTENTIEFSTTHNELHNTWVMRITADRRIEVNEDVEVTETAKKVLEAMQYLLEQQRTWVGLTDEEILDNCESVPDYDIGNHDLIQFARAIEAKLKEKNELR